MINQIQDVLSMWFTIDRSAVSALTDFRVVYVASPDQASQLEVLRDSVSEKQSLLITSLKILRSLSEQAHKLAFDSVDRKSTRLNSSHVKRSRMPSSA